MKRYLSLAALALAAAIALAGCGGTGTQTATTAPASSAAAAQSPSASAQHNSADVMFVQMMIPHHEQAIQMSGIMLAKKDIDPKITDLARRIKAAQTPEIQAMQGWLDAWNEPSMMGTPSAGMDGHGMGSTGASPSPGMSGMMTRDELYQLKDARGTEAEKLFLTGMTAHHEGAVQMAEQEQQNGSSPQTIALAGKIIKDQEAEIREMKDLLAGR
jgi:uncharacterized protein (DUF305 family)